MGKSPEGLFYLFQHGKVWFVLNILLLGDQPLPHLHTPFTGAGERLTVALEHPWQVMLGCLPCQAVLLQDIQLQPPDTHPKCF